MTQIIQLSKRVYYTRFINYISLYRCDYDDRNIDDSDDNNNNSNSLNINSDRNMRSLQDTLTLGLFDGYLNQLEALEIINFVLTIKDKMICLNLNKIRSLTFYVKHHLNLSGLDVIKTEFGNLKVLHLKALNLKLDSFIFTNSEVDPNINFDSSLEIKIKGDIEFQFNCLSDFKQLKSIGSLYLDYTIFESKSV
ncbi:hypothetical protein K502DRAFT_352878 [Neoconidiobolus thromboides FSU 785]|nr:hypothetical protein K502DRAFT_352878 [Neoconidiobolus thromboides FSU 785]